MRNNSTDILMEVPDFACTCTKRQSLNLNYCSVFGAPLGACVKASWLRTRARSLECEDNSSGPILMTWLRDKYRSRKNRCVNAGNGIAIYFPDTADSVHGIEGNALWFR